MEERPKQSLVVTSTIEVKFISCFEVTLHGVQLKSFIYRLKIIDYIFKPIKIYRDNSTIVFQLKIIKIVVKLNILTLSIYP